MLEAVRLLASQPLCLWREGLAITGSSAFWEVCAYCPLQLQ